MLFADSIDSIDKLEDPTFLDQFTKNDLFRFIEIFTLAIVALMAILLVLRPLISNLFAIDNEKSSATAALTNNSGSEEGLLDSEGAPALEGQAPIPEAIPSAQPSEIDRLISLNQVEGEVRATSLKKVGDMVEHHPEEAVSIIRNWIYEEN